MIVTEQIAKTKKCPHLPPDIFVENCNDGVAHRVIAYPPCIASACMAWEWTYPSEQDGAPEERRGHCGLSD